MSFCSFLWSKALQQLSTLTSLTMWAFMISFEAERCCSGSWRCSRWTSIPLLERRQSPSHLQVAKSPPTKSPSLLQVIKAASTTILKAFWLDNFFHTPESAIVYCQQVGTHLLQLTTQVVLAAVLIFFRIFPHICSCVGFNTSTSEIWTSAANMVSQHLFFSIKRTSSRRQTPS